MATPPTRGPLGLAVSSNAERAATRVPCSVHHDFSNAGSEKAISVSIKVPNLSDTREAWVSVISGGIHSEAGVVLPVLSGSMGPLIVGGCSMRVVPVPPEGSATGDIVVFLDGHDLTAHRQLARMRIGRKSFIFQKGDMNPHGSWIPIDRVVGLVAEAKGPDGKPLYSRELYACKARMEARRQLASIVFRPFHRLARALWRLFSGRAGSDELES
jgi:hypothetical protein